MFRKVTLALVAAASLGAAALAPTAASAGGGWGGGWHHHHHNHWRHGFGIGFVGGGYGDCYRTRLRADAVRLSLPHRERLRLLIQTLVRLDQEPRPPKAAGVFPSALLRNLVTVRGTPER